MQKTANTLSIVKNKSTQEVNEVSLPLKFKHYVGNEKGIQAPGDRVSVHTEMNVTQRDLHHKDVFGWIEKHKGVDWNLFGYVTCVRFPDGKLEMINGQHRTWLVKKILPDVLEVPAHIIDIEEQDYAARLFAAMNGGSSRRLTTEELFWSEVIGKDPYALYVRDQLVSMGIGCGKVNEGPRIKLVKYPNFVKCLKMGDLGVGATQRAVELIDTGYPDNGIDDQVLSGLTKLLSLKEYADFGDTDTNIGQQFENWFQEIIPNSYPLIELRFNEFKNTSQWYNGVAYGLAKKFKYFQNKNKLEKVDIRIIRDIYENGINRVDN
jgi:hypothetical protein